MTACSKNKKRIFASILLLFFSINLFAAVFIFPIKTASAEVILVEDVAALFQLTYANFQLGTANTNLGTANTNLGNIKGSIEKAAGEQKARDEEKSKALIEKDKDKALTLAERWAQLDLWKEAINLAKVAGIALLNTLLQKLTDQIIAWINGGETPEFITDWEGFLTEAADKAGGKFVEENLGAGILCEPFDFQIQIALSTNPPFSEAAKCTISDIVENVDNFYNDFEQGGWDAFIRITEPQNNVYGAMLIANDAKLAAMDAARQAAQNEGLAGSGFKSAKDDDGKIKTPGSVLSYEVNKAVDSSRQLIQDSIAQLVGNQEWPYDQISVAITAIANALLNRVIKEGLGAVGVSQ